MLLSSMGRGSQASLHVPLALQISLDSTNLLDPRCQMAAIAGSVLAFT